MYNRFAFFYDALMQDAKYQERTEYIVKLFNHYGKIPALLLDLACGTGGFSLPFAKLGCSVIGVDASEEMLSQAFEKRGDNDILYLCQDMTNLDLYGTVDGAICCLDSLNHITDYKALCKVFDRLSLFCEPGALFIFDMNTAYKHRNTLGNNSFVWEENGLFVSWQNSYNPKTHILSAKLDFFSPNADGSYTRSSETVCERDYSEDEINRALNNSGFDILAVLGDMSMEEPKETADRVYYVVRKR